MAARQVRLGNYIAYGSNDFLGAGAMSIIGLWVAFFYTTYCGLTVGEAGLIVVAARLLDAFFSPLIGYVGLAVEATLPLPQMFANARTRSCRGFRPSVLVSWIAGDAMKMFWFFTSVTEIPWAFKLCGIFQAACVAVVF
jgi:hypothetical protein